MLHTNQKTQQLNGRDRRRHVRWEPRHHTLAWISSNEMDDAWCGSILNFSRGGCALVGSPSSVYLPGTRLDIEIPLSQCSLKRSGILLRAGFGPKANAFVLKFDTSTRHTTIQTACPCCHSVVILMNKQNTPENDVQLCAECQDRARERLSTDFDYDELGWG